MTISGKKRIGFTLIEILIIVVLIGGGLLIVIRSLFGSNNYLMKTRQKIIAINLAREGMEQMYHIRESNWQQRAGKRDATRLKVDPLNDNGNDGPENDTRITAGNYSIIQTGKSQLYFMAQKIPTPLSINSGTNATGNLPYSLCLTGGLWTTCSGQIPQSPEGYFFRKIDVKGLFGKNTASVGGTPLNCTNGTSGTCGDASAKELRFCSVVEYIGISIGKVELCGILTNFRE